jgi:hypothetical protein
MWNYCTFSVHTLIRFSFQLFDTDDSGYLEVVSVCVCVVGGPNMCRPIYAGLSVQGEVRSLVEDVYGTSIQNNGTSPLLSHHSHV